MKKEHILIGVLTAGLLVTGTMAVSNGALADDTNNTSSGLKSKGKIEFSDADVIIDADDFDTLNKKIEGVSSSVNNTVEQKIETGVRVAYHKKGEKSPQTVVFSPVNSQKVTTGPLISDTAVTSGSSVSP